MEGGLLGLVPESDLSSFSNCKLRQHRIMSNLLNEEKQKRTDSESHYISTNIFLKLEKFR